MGSGEIWCAPRRGVSRPKSDRYTFPSSTVGSFIKDRMIALTNGQPCKFQQETLVQFARSPVYPWMFL